MKTGELTHAMDLRVGDEILQHGGAFRVRAIIKAVGSPERGIAPCHANICDYLGLAEGYDKCHIPVHWRTDWNAQGNERMRVYVLKRAEVS